MVDTEIKRNFDIEKTITLLDNNSYTQTVFGVGFWGWGVGMRRRCRRLLRQHEHTIYIYKCVHKCVFHIDWLQQFARLLSSRSARCLPRIGTRRTAALLLQLLRLRLIVHIVHNGRGDLLDRALYLRRHWLQRA